MVEPPENPAASLFFGDHRVIANYDRKEGPNMIKRFLTDENGIDHPVALGISIAAVALLVAALYAATKGGYGAIQNGLGSTTNSAGNALNGIK
jgi:hypothetical protein